MRPFSERKGFKPVRSIMQVDDMDTDLRNKLWNALTTYYFKRDIFQNLISNDRSLVPLVNAIWHYYFAKPIDTISVRWDRVREEIRRYFFSCEWSEVYDFLEFVASNSIREYEVMNRRFKDFCNSVLEQEVSAYRFVGGKITQITSEEEIAEVEEALAISGPFKPVADHVKRALDLLSDRQSPDYRNSTKESILAVEAICELIANDDKATLGQALRVVEDRVGLHPALKEAFNRLYGYTSDAEGIRHALLDEPTLDFEDAKFMLVSCSAFINYLTSKSSKAGISL